MRFSDSASDDQRNKFSLLLISLLPFAGIPLSSLALSVALIAFDVFCMQLQLDSSSSLLISIILCFNATYGVPSRL